MPETQPTHTILTMLIDAENISPGESDRLHRTLGRIRGPIDPMPALLRATIAEQVYLTDQQVRHLSYLAAKDHASIDPQDRDPALVRADRTADRIMMALNLSVDTDEATCDSDGVDAVGVNGVMTVPYQCPDCR